MQKGLGISDQIINGIGIMIKIAMALFKQDETKKSSMKAKNKMTRLDDEYRSTLMESGKAPRLPTCA